MGNLAGRARTPALLGSVLLAAMMLGACTGGSGSSPTPAGATLQPSGTLYVASANIYSYSLDASPTLKRTFTGLYTPQFPGSHESERISGLAADAAGSIYIELFNTAGSQGFGFCDIDGLVPDASGPDVFRGTAPGCDGVFLHGFGIALNGDVIELVLAQGAGVGIAIDRYTRSPSGTYQGVYASRFLPDAPPGGWTSVGMSVDGAGDMFVVNDGLVRVYAAGATTGASPVRTFTLNGSQRGARSAAADGTLYVAGFVPNGSAPAVYAFAPGATSPSRVVTVPGTRVSALTVALDGTLYVAIVYPAAPYNAVVAYSPTANGFATPILRIDGAVPPSDPVLSNELPSGGFIPVINSIAVGR